MNNFCTVFDKNYLVQGIALYDSLAVNCSENFTLYCLCIDDVTFEILTKLKLDNLVPLNVNELKDDLIDRIQLHVTYGQFCWICQPLIIEFLFVKYNLHSVIYLEADSYFFNDPQLLIDEIKDYSVSLVPHNFSPNYENIIEAGIYCVQFNYFKNNLYGRRVIDYWKNNCFNYSANKPRSFPGQLCLDNWPILFKNVFVIKHLGAGVAPWNIQHVNIMINDETLYINDSKIIFFHFHQYGIYENGYHELGHYPLNENVVNLLYKPYIHAIENAMVCVQKFFPAFTNRRVYRSESFTLKHYGALLKRKILGRYNIRKPSFHINLDPS
jgi:hypothetical protein